MSFYPAQDPETRPLLLALRAALPDAVQEASDHRGDLKVRVPRERVREVLGFLKSDPGTGCVFLMDLAGVDWLGREPRFDVVYHLYSLANRSRIRIATGVPEEDPVVDSATSVWKGAYWFERECYDLFGILFRGHPFLRRLLTHDDFVGHALRKDYDQHQRWRCTRVSDLESTVPVPGEAPAAPEG